jgi:hypothetical protein
MELRAEGDVQIARLNPPHIRFTQKLSSFSSERNQLSLYSVSKNNLGVRITPWAIEALGMNSKERLNRQNTLTVKTNQKCIRRKASMMNLLSEDRDLSSTAVM